MAKSKTTHQDAFIFRCGSCSGKLSARVGSIGKTLPCPKCKANVTVHPPRMRASSGASGTLDPCLQGLIGFVYAIELFSLSPTFNTFYDPPIDEELWANYLEVEGDPAAYPRDVLDVLATFVMRLKIQLQANDESARLELYPKWDSLIAARRFFHLYWAMAQMDHRFAAPFQLADEDWITRPRTIEETEQLLSIAVESFEAVTQSFIRYFTNSDIFSRESLAEAFKGCQIVCQPRIACRKKHVGPPAKAESEPAAHPTHLICAGCENQLSPRHRFCGRCGQAVLPRCNSCGEAALSSDCYCRSCGHQLSN